MNGAMSLSHHHPLDVLRFARDLAVRGAPFAVVVTANVTGGTMRAQGALMCVPESGDAAGYVSNGCVDADIIFQARESLKDGRARQLTYGEGSPFKDITLPCGGRIDLWAVPNMDADLIIKTVEGLERREAATLDFGVDGFSHTYAPKLRIRMAGKGESVKALAAQALGAGFDVIVQSPEADIANGLDGADFDHLHNPDDPPAINDDAWTAVVLMFHDHDWEPDLLAQAVPLFDLGGRPEIMGAVFAVGHEVIGEQGGAIDVGVHVSVLFQTLRQCALIVEAEPGKVVGPFQGFQAAALIPVENGLGAVGVID